MGDSNEVIATMPDGRAVGVADYGSPGQTPVIWCRGGPGCRFEPAPCAAAVAHARYSQRIVPGAVLDVREGLGHFSIIPEVIPVLGDVLASDN